MTPHLADTPVLETARLTLRAPAPQDYPAWQAFFLTDRASFVGGGTTHDAGRAWRAFASLIGHWAMHGFGIFAVVRRDTGTAIGSCGPWFPALWPEREVGWSIWDPATEGKGYMSEAARAVFAHIFDDLGWTTAVSYIDPANARSKALAERLGGRVDTSATPTPAHPGDLVYRYLPEARA